MLSLDPLHEPAQSTVIRLLAEDGQRVAAPRQFEAFRQLLAEEFGLPPDQATVELVVLSSLTG